MDSLVQVKSQLFLVLDRFRKCLFPSLHLIGGFLRAVLVVNDLQRTTFLDGTVGGTAIWAVDNFSSHRVYGFVKCRAVNIFHVGSPEAFEICPSVRFLEHDASTILADGLENSDGLAEVANVKYGNDKFDVGIMAGAVDIIETTSFTEC